MRLSTSDDMDKCTWGKKLKDEAVKVGEWYKLESLPSVIGNAYLLRSNAAVYLLITELPGSHDWPHMHRFYVDGTEESSTTAVEWAKEVRKK